MDGDDLAARPVSEVHEVLPEQTALPGRWVAAGDLRIGDRLLLHDGRTLPIEYLKLESLLATVYNFHVDEYKTYAVGHHHFLVHNTHHVSVPDVPNRTGYGPFGYPSGGTKTAREAVEQVTKPIPAYEKQAKSIAKRIERELGKSARRDFHDLKDKALGDRTIQEAIEDAISLYEDAGKDVPQWLLDRLN